MISVINDPIIYVWINTFLCLRVQDRGISNIGVARVRKPWSNRILFTNRVTTRKKRMYEEVINKLNLIDINK